MLRKIRKMKYGTTVLACVAPAVYMTILAACTAVFPGKHAAGHLVRLGAGVGTALAAYMYHMGARELPERRNILIAAVHLLLFAVLYILLLLFALHSLPVISAIYDAVVGHSSVSGAWMFMFCMEIARSIKKL